MKGDFTITKEVTSGGYNMPYSHMHNSFEIYLLISGDRTVIIDDEKHKIQPVMSHCSIKTFLTGAMVMRHTQASALSSRTITSICTSPH